MGGRKQRERDIHKLGYSLPEERRSFFDGIGDLASVSAGELLVLAVGLLLAWGVPGC